MKLLEVTREGRRVNIVDLESQLHIRSGQLFSEIESLHNQGFASVAGGLLELDGHQRMRLAEELVRNGSDPRNVSRFLEWQEFEGFAARYLVESGFRTVGHLLFKASVGRREIDLLAWNDNFAFAIDCKHWARGLAAARLRKAAEAQIERTTALASRPDILRKYGVTGLEKRSIMPVIFSLAEPSERFVSGVAVVPVSKFPSFLGGISPLESDSRMIRIKTDHEQATLG
jgi:Holliday junction resolvase-like predicted endonuclease